MTNLLTLNAPLQENRSGHGQVPDGLGGPLYRPLRGTTRPVGTLERDGDWVPPGATLKLGEQPVPDRFIELINRLDESVPEEKRS